MGKYVVAVSGGVDSVVLLDMLAGRPDLELIVAHFDHGIRPDSAEDAAFVGELSKRYNAKFETKREELGPDASEKTARDRRYRFLREISKKYDAKIVTAHHADDVVETIAINLSRGTGWRGLSAMDSSDVVRPLRHVFKSEILAYARRHDLKWHEDSTNKSDSYLRNRIRHKMLNLSEDSKRQLLGLWEQQKLIRVQIEKETADLVGSGPKYSRYFFIHIDNKTGLECLRHIIGNRLTRPQMINVLYRIKTALPGKTYEAGGGVVVNFTARNFTVKLIK